MLVPITALYAAPLALVGLVLAARAGAQRGKLKIAVGDGGHDQLLQNARAHANYTEYVPLILVLMALLELNGAGAGWLHSIGGGLLAARIAHPFGIGSVSSPARFFGAALTMLALLACIVLLGMQSYGAMI
jgi:uncharacterized membrane protein YecN with MAPEG domain